MKEYKKITGNELQIGQRIRSYTIDNKSILPWRDYVKNITDSDVILGSSQFINDEGEAVPKTALFEIELSFNEVNKKYYDVSFPIYQALKNGEYVGDHGYHTMWNVWLGSSCQEIYQACKKENLTVIGWFWLPEIKHGWFDDYDIGIIAEDINGERFWCHWTKKAIETICSIYEDAKGIS